MGLGNTAPPPTAKTGKIYLRISNGKIVREVKEKTATSVKRKNKNDKVVHEEFYGDISGFLIDIFDKEDIFKSYQLHLVIKDGDDTYVLQVLLDSVSSRSLLNRFSNLDLSQAVTIRVSEECIKGTEKTYTYAVFEQDGAKIPEKYKTEDLPNIGTKTVDGKEQKDYAHQTEFLIEKATEYFEASKNLVKE